MSLATPTKAFPCGPPPFINTDGTIAVVLTNTSDHEQLAQVWVAGKALKFSCPANGVMTLTM
jgi:hypothetical protein